MYFRNDGGGEVFLVFKNDDVAVKAADLIIKQNARSLNKSGQLQTMSASAGEQCIAGPFDADIFTQPEQSPDPGGVVYVDLTDDTSVSFAALRFIRSPRT